MKSKVKIEESMIAPCGINCMLCHNHLFGATPCPGCNMGFENKGYNCLSCDIRKCSRLNKVSLCAECEKFPCKSIKQLEKGYVKDNNTSVIGNGENARDNGKQKFLTEQLKDYVCDCGGIIDLQDACCSECRKLRKKNGK